MKTNLNKNKKREKLNYYFINEKLKIYNILISCESPGLYMPYTIPKMSQIISKYQGTTIDNEFKMYPISLIHQNNTIIPIHSLSQNYHSLQLEKSPELFYGPFNTFSSFKGKSKINLKQILSTFFLPSTLRFFQYDDKKRQNSCEAENFREVSNEKVSQLKPGLREPRQRLKDNDFLSANIVFLSKKKNDTLHGKVKKKEKTKNHEQ